jgi:hypothetical protein
MADPAGRVKIEAPHPSGRVPGEKIDAAGACRLAGPSVSPDVERGDSIHFGEKSHLFFQSRELDPKP